MKRKEMMELMSKGQDGNQLLLITQAIQKTHKGKRK
jgi:hypothetical protein